MGLVHCEANILQIEPACCGLPNIEVVFGVIDPATVLYCVNGQNYLGICWHFMLQR